MKKVRVPKKLQGILWSVDVKNLDVDKDKSYIINQILSLGFFEELKWLIKTYGLQTIRRVFLHQPSRVYPDFIFNFVKNYLLGLKNKKINENAYVTSLFGALKPRATENI